MYKKAKIIIVVLTMIVMVHINAQAQDKCGCVIDVTKGEITIPKVDNKNIVVTVYYGEKFINNIIYKDWKSLQKDFPNASTASTLTLHFDWELIAKHPDWNIIQRDSVGNLYLGTYYDIKEDYLASSTKIVKLSSWCGSYTCSPNIQRFNISVIFGPK